VGKVTPPQWIDRVLNIGPYLTLCLSEAQYNRLLDEIDVPPYDRDCWVSESCVATAHRFTTADGQRIAVICLDEKPMADSPIDVVAMLVHEAVHVWQRHCEFIGESKPGIEIEAYGIENIVRGLLVEYCRQRGHPTREGTHLEHFKPKITRFVPPT
jgi:hypothetical protein